MILAPLKVIGLALLLLAPSSAPVRAGEDPPEEPEIVIEDDGAFAFAFGDDDEPLVLRHRLRLGGGFIGIRLLDMTPELRAHYGAPRDAGVLVSEVEPDSPAAKAGVQVGDIITEAGGDRIEEPGDLSRAVRGKKTGETLDLEVSRDRNSKRLTVTVEERKRSGIGPRGHGERERGRRRFRLRDRDSMRQLLGQAEGLPRLQERMDDLEKKLNELQKRLDARGR